MLRPLNRQRCPVDQALELLGGKWKPLILWRLSRGTMRYAELMRALPGVTQRMLTLQLRELERDGLVLRTVHSVKPPHVDYALTPPGQDLLPHLAALGDWLVGQHAALHAGSAVQREAAAPAFPGVLLHRL